MRPSLDRGKLTPVARARRRRGSQRCAGQMGPQREDDMATAKDGIELTRVGPGTVMGDLMRCYWIPALMSSELRRDAAPTRLMLLGEQLIAFRDSSGRVGVMDHRCPHRCASLFL